MTKKNINEDYRIVKLKANDFRSHLTTDDLVSDKYGEAIEVIGWSNEDFKVPPVEDAYVFLDVPIIVPNMPYLFRGDKIFTVNDELLIRVVGDLIYLNPTIGDKGVIKLSSFIGRALVHYKEDDTEHSASGRVIPFDALLTKVIDIVSGIRSGNIPFSIIERNKLILFRPNSLLELRDKSFYAIEVRSARISKLNGEIIHEGAILASEMIDPNLRISNPIVLDGIESSTNKTHDITSLTTVLRYMENRTKMFLIDENVGRPIKTMKTLEKLHKYLRTETALMSLNAVSKLIGVDKRTIKLFEQIKNKK